MSDLTERDVEEINLIRGLINSGGWQRWFIPKLKEMMDFKYAKLRKVNRDASFYRIQGYLDALDTILKLPQDRESELNPESRS